MGQFCAYSNPPNRIPLVGPRRTNQLDFPINRGSGPGRVVPSLVYRPRRPDHEALHKIVRDHYETFRAKAAGRRGGQGLQQFVDLTFEDFLTRGCLAAGFARFRCMACWHERLAPGAQCARRQRARSRAPENASVLGRSGRGRFLFVGVRTATFKQFGGNSTRRYLIDGQSR